MPGLIPISQQPHELDIMEKQRETFGSRFAVIMTLAGSAIGLGNIWRFPYMVGENGGAAFILLYLFFSFFFSLPIFMVESIIGRRSGANCLGAVKKLGGGGAWKLLGYLSIITPLIIVSYYSVIGGWSIEFFTKAISLSFLNADPESVNGMFGDFISGFWGPTIFFTIFLCLSCLIVAGGVKKGIEKFSKICIPLLFFMVLLIMIFSISLPGSSAGIDYLVKPDFSKLTFAGCAAALGQSFFSLSLGMGIIITYSSYVSKSENLMASGTYTAVFDTIFAMMAGFAIMPAVFMAGIKPSAGPGLIFQTLPFIFTKMGMTMPWLSSAVAAIFFLTIIISALTSSVSLIEVGVAYLVEEKKLRRGVAAAIVFLGTWIVGLLCSLSLGPVPGLSVFGKPVFDALDMFSSNFLLLIGSFLAVLLVGWKMSKADVRDEFTNGGRLKKNNAIFGVLYFIIRYVTPIALVFIFITNFIL